METLEQLVKRINDPAINGLLDLLILGNTKPTMSREASGMYGSYNPKQNHLMINRQLVGNAERDTTGHELVHAVDEAMGRYARQPGNEKFKQAYQKLDPTKSQLPAIKNLYDMSKAGKTVGSNTAYRFDGYELPAFGYQNHAIGDPNKPSFRPAPSHVDATMATELSILMDLYARSLKGKYK